MYIRVYAICGLELFRIPLEKQLLCVVWNEDEIIGISPYTAVRKAGQMKVWKWKSDQGRVLSWPGNPDGGTNLSFHIRLLRWGSSWRGLREATGPEGPRLHVWLWAWGCIRQRGQQSRRRARCGIEDSEGGLGPTGTLPLTMTASDDVYCFTSAFQIFIQNSFILASFNLEPYREGYFGKHSFHF